MSSVENAGVGDRKGREERFSQPSELIEVEGATLSEGENNGDDDGRPEARKGFHTGSGGSDGA